MYSKNSEKPPIIVITHNIMRAIQAVASAIIFTVTVFNSSADYTVREWSDSGK